ncbi:MAG TPA: A/G-specific adenine glycosylase [Pseudomonadota bacterium]|nr:A/G-specific adenine glycosylase [Pseudomonadota bacterium]
MPGRSRKSRTAAAEDGLPDIALSSRQRQALRTALLTWYRRSHRDLPWRRSRDPYAIWISEIMLQQTRVDTVRDYYARFMARFPTISDLAEAPQADVLSLWSGLGYYARARNLHAAAGEIATRYGGQFPREAEAVHALPGIGPYTAGAIRSIAFGQRAPILDGNVTRVLSRLFAIPAGPEQAAAKRLYWRLAEELLPAELAAADADAPNDVGDFNQALMELGATVCTPHRPGCLLCPLSGDCEARARDQQELFPPPKATRPVPVLRAVTAILSPQPGPRDLAVPVLLVRRPGSGLWGGLWEPPSLWLSEATSDQPAETPAAGLARLLTEKLGLTGTALSERLAACLPSAQPLPPFTHVLTHRELRFSPVALALPAALLKRLQLDGYDEARVVDAAAPLGLALSAWVSALLSRVAEQAQVASI